jgi:hypothetical protein
MPTNKTSGYLAALKKYLASKSTGQAVGIGAAGVGGLGAAKNIAVVGLLRNTELGKRLVPKELPYISPFAEYLNPIVKAQREIFLGESPLTAYGTAAGIGLGIGALKGGILGLGAKKATSKLAQSLRVKHAESVTGKVLRASGSGLVGGLKGYGLGALGLAGLREALLSSAPGAVGFDAALNAVNSASAPTLLATGALGAGLGLKRALKPGADLVVPKSYLLRGLGTGASIGAMSGIAAHNDITRQLMSALNESGNLNRVISELGVKLKPEFVDELAKVTKEVANSGAARGTNATLGLGMGAAGALHGGVLGLGVGGVQKLLSNSTSKRLK